jgi:signal recognition particle subunit SRP54
MAWQIGNLFRRKLSTFTLIDFKNAMSQIKKLGPLQSIMRLIPGMRKVADMMAGDLDPDVDLQQIEGIINSMTPAERENPGIIDIGRRRRIAAGSGTDAFDVNKLLKEFSLMSAMMEQMADMSKIQQFHHLRQMAASGMFNPQPPWPRHP